MDNREIAWILLQIGNLVELRGDSKYAGQSYKRAARLIERSDPVVELIKSKNLRKLEGIGEKIAQNIIDIVQLGYSPKLERLRQQLPESLIRLTNIQGITPQRAYLLHKELGVDTIEKLEEAITTKDILKVKGFGLSTVNDIKRGIELYKQRGRSFLLGLALPLAYEYIRDISELKGVENVELTGDVRRMKETISSIDLLITSTKCSDQLLKENQHYFMEDGYEKQGNKIILESKFGIPIIMYITTENDYGYNKIVSTGNEKHIEELIKLGLRDVKDKTVESSIYNHIGLEYIPPYLREGSKEIRLAKEERIPSLIKISDIKGDLHNHTSYSDGLSTVTELAGAAKDLGYQYVAVTDHSQSLKIAKGLTKERILKQWQEIDRIQEEFDIKIFKGIEVDILPDGRLDFDNEFLSRFDLVVASVHSNFKQSEREMTNRIITALKNPHVDIIGHVTGRLILKRSAYALDIDEIFNAAKQEKIAFEINSSPDRLDLKSEHVLMAKEFGIKIAINTDSHSTIELANILLGVGIGQRGYLEKEDVLNCWELKELEAYLRG